MMQLDGEDLVKLDRKRFVEGGRYSAGVMLEYLRENEEGVRRFIEEKEFTNKLREKVSVTSEKISKFVIVNGCHRGERSVAVEVNGFVEMLRRCEGEMERYLKNENVKEIRTQLVDFVGKVRKCIRFLSGFASLA